MNSSEIKERLQQYIETGDEKLLQLMYIVAREYSNDKEPELDESEIQLLEERWDDYKNGVSKSYSWDEVKEILAKRKAD